MDATTETQLALNGGPQAVTMPYKDGWQVVPAEEAKAAIGAMLDEGIVTLSSAGGVIGEFEAAFREMVGTRHALCVTNGTSALHSAYFAAGVGPGTEVIVPSYTWHASVTPILHCSGTPVFCDIDPDTLCADPEDIRGKVTERTRAICVVHIWGNIVDMDPVMEIAEEHGLIVIEDASHAHGATYKGRPVGSIGHIGCFSLQGQKAVSGGEAGIVTTDDPVMLDHMLLLAQFGRVLQGEGSRTFDHLGDMSLGAKYRAHPYAVALALANLRRLPELNRKRTHNYAVLNDALRGIPGVETIEPRPESERAGYLEYKFKVSREAVDRVPLDRIEEAIKAEGAPFTRDRYSNMNFTYGALHQAPLFTTFDRRTLPGCFYDPILYTGPTDKPVSLPHTEDVCGRLMSCYAAVDVDEEYLIQIAGAVRKVMENLEQLG